MLRALLNRWRPSRKLRIPVRRGRCHLGIDRLEDRAVPAVTATFASGQLSVFGDGLDNKIMISRNAAGAILVNGGGIAVKGGAPTVANTATIQVFGLDGNDAISLNESNGALPRALLFGGAGNDILTGGSGADMLFGQAGDDILLGKGGADLLFGGADNDTLTGGTGDDQVFGESGNDQMIWNPGESTDLNEGGAGIDTIIVNGGNGSETFTVTANGSRVRFDRINPAPFSIDIGTSEKLVVNANGGDDAFSATGNLAVLIQITVDGGTGNDTLLGSNGADLLIGGDGNDFIDGQQGNDTALMGAGNDVFQWDPGDGSDTVEGQDGSDTMIFNGSAANEVFNISANGERVRLFRTVGNVTMDLNDVEGIDLNAFAGVDNITVGEISATDLVALNINLGVNGAGDTQADTVILTGTNNNDIIDVFGAGTSLSVVGLSALVNITNSEGANDSLLVSALAGNDGLTASTLDAGIIKLSLEGGTGDDTILGSRGDDVLEGGDGNDFIDGHQGNDLVLLGDGNDVFQWDPGDGSDTVEGQDGIDTMLFFGSNASENIDISANGPRVRFSRDVGNITMDLNGLENIEFRALGGADNITVSDLTGTALILVELDLRGPIGQGDGEPDSITVNGTQGDDSFGVAGDIGGVSVFGLQTKINIFHQESALDRLTLNALGGNDRVDAISLEADGIQLTMNGGAGTDLLIGSDGNDVINGGQGNDAILMGAGDDTFTWNPGDGSDVVEGQSGHDVMVFNGANVNENIDISANGGRLRFLRNVANIAMDVDDVEQVDFNALGGVDNIVVNDLTGTDVTEVNVNLSAIGGGGDGSLDNVIVHGTNGDDVVMVVGDQFGVSVLGLATQVNITGHEADNDRLTVMTFAGDDVINASGLTAAILFTTDAGDGDDILIGSDGNDTFLGGAGDDVLIGGLGIDVLDGGTGDNIVIQ